MEVTLTTETGATLEAIYTVPVENLAWLDGHLAKLNKRTAKLGLAPIVCNRLGAPMWQQEGTNDQEQPIMRQYQQVSIVGQAPVLNGWRLAATLEHEAAGTVVRSVPGVEVPPQYRTRPQWCDQCKTSRRRNDTYVVLHEDGRTAQVGSDCLKDFLGHASPHSLAAYAELWDSLADMLSEGGEHSGNGAAFEHGIPVLGYLAFVAAAIREHGWLSRSAARDNDSYSTADRAYDSMFPPKNLSRREREELLVTQEQDDKRATAALAWARDGGLDTTSEYGSNLAIAVAGDYMSRRLTGIAASVFVGYGREVEKLARAAAVAARPYTPGYLGAVGDKVQATVTVVGFREIEGQYGVTYLVTMLAADGHWLKWFASNPAINPTGQPWDERFVTEGDVLVVAGTVKAQEEYNGHEYSALTRAKFCTEEQAQKKPAKKK